MYFLSRRTGKSNGLVVNTDDWSVINESKIDAFDVHETEIGFAIFIRCGDRLYTLEDERFNSLENALNALQATFKI